MNSHAGTIQAGTVVDLAEHSVPEMLDLVARTRPGPSWPRTRELGRCLGVWENGVLVAMAGERLRPQVWTEISAVCTAPARLRGRLTPALISGIVTRGEISFPRFAEANDVATQVRPGSQKTVAVVS